MESEPQSSRTPLKTEMEIFDFRIRVAYYDRQQQLAQTRIASTSRERRNIRELPELSVDRSIREVGAVLGNKHLSARNAAFRYRKHDPDASISSVNTWVAHHYDYLATNILLQDERLDYEALNETLIEEGFEPDAVAEARERFEHFLLTEF